MMTPERWKQLAEFAGVDQRYWNGNAFVIHQPFYAKEWQPLTEWSDFGPLLLLLLRWSQKASFFEQRKVEALLDALELAVSEGTDHELMQAGCLLGAAIGATMGDKKQ